MPYRQHSYYRAPSAHQTLAVHHLPLTATLSSAGDDDLAAEADEPPDEPLHFGRLSNWNPHDSHFVAHCQYVKTFPLQQSERRESLLTRALLTGPENAPEDDIHLHDVSHYARATRTASTWSNASAASTADLTSDGGLTSPTRTNSPSPPLPPTHLVGGGSPKVAPLSALHHGPSDRLRVGPVAGTDTSEHESAVEAGLGRKRCITFACGRTSPASDSQSQAGAKTDATNASKDAKKPEQPQPRRCAIKFVCPSRTESPQVKEPSPVRQPPSPATATAILSDKESTTETLQLPQPTSSRPHRDSESTVRNESPGSATQSTPSQKPSARPDLGFEQSETARFHEFASSFDEEDDWVNESTVHKERMTVNDTLKKENAIRQMGEEVEQEAEEEEANDDDEDDEDDDDDDDAGEEDEASDFSSDEDVEGFSEGGNETDNEEGFADSDDESDAASDYQFWTPTVKNVAAAAQMEMIRPTPRRSASESSIESHQSPRQAAEMKAQLTEKTKDLAKARRRSRALARHDTPELPDSTDFVCGTFDEDRPLEAAYVSCLEERKRAKYAPVPQDIDPSFPMSDPDDDDDDDSGEEVPVRGRRGSRGRNSPKGQGFKKPSPRGSPQRLRSPPPPPKRNICRSPPPRNLFGHSPRRLRSPPPARHIKSPPATRAASPRARNRIQEGCPFGGQQLTRTKSLPRTPNPFRYYERDLHAAMAEPLSPPGTELRARRAIDIVKGLEKKRQRRKQKFWQKHYRHAAKEKEKKPQPGKGLERMRELGLEMAGKGRGWLGHNDPQYMLSI